MCTFAPRNLKQNNYVRQFYIPQSYEEGKTDEQVAMEGLETMEQWMRELGLAMNITECGAKPELIEGMADACPICQGGYYILNRDEVVQVLKDSL